MLGSKRIRKNYKKNSSEKRLSKIIRNVVFSLKVLTGTSALFFISFSFIFIHDFLTQCNYFNADIISIQGARRLSETQIIRQAQIYKGINILSVHLETIRRRLIANPWIADAEVSRELPNRIHVQITEHQALAVLNLGRNFLINTEGEIFKEKTSSDPDNLPVISGLEFSDISLPGKPLGTAFESVLEVLRLGQQSACILPNRLIQRIHLDKEIGLTLYTKDHNSGGVKAIKLGYTNYPNKYERLKTVLFYLKRGNQFSDFETIDLNNSDRIVISPVRIQTSPGDHKEV